jgi:AcrR family transcriptional regulator
MDNVLKRDETVPGTPPRVDGRRLRSARTRLAILAAYVECLREHRSVPTAEQVARAAKLSERAVFAHFADMEALAVAAFDFILGQRHPAPVSDAAHPDLDTRIRLQVRVRAETCENWLPLWRIVVSGNLQSSEIAKRSEIVRGFTRQRLERMYAPELAALEECDRIATMNALEALFDFESWGRLREQYGLSVDQACEAWTRIVGRLLKPTGNSPAKG